MGTFKRGFASLRQRIRRGLQISQSAKIGSESILLPPEHLLLDYQRLYPMYDSYFLPFFSQLSSVSGGGGWTFIDIGANVGDTTAAVLSCSPEASVVAVEGSPYFLSFLRTNFQNRPQVRILNRFVTHKKGIWQLVSNGSTGHLVEVNAVDDGRKLEPKASKKTRIRESSTNAPENSSEQYETITPQEILDFAVLGNLCIWKSDTDGYDIPILLGSFDEVVASCAVLWIEFDPVGNLSDASDVNRLIEKIAALPREVVLFDNFGHRMSRFPCDKAQKSLEDVVSWLWIQNSHGTRVVPYVDMWILPKDLADVLCSGS